jgi:hypothetical protein
MENNNFNQIYLLNLIRKENNLIVDEVLLGIYTDLDELKNAASGYILRNGEELYITTKKLNEKLTNRDIDFEDEECMKVNKDYLDKIIDF